MYVNNPGCFTRGRITSIHHFIGSVFPMPLKAFVVQFIGESTESSGGEGVMRITYPFKYSVDKVNKFHHWF